MKLPKIKLNNETKIKLIGLLTILVSIWFVLYFIPTLFLSLFDTLLGNLILIIVALLTFINNRVYGILISILFIILFRFHQLSVREGFYNNKDNNRNQFTEDSKQTFLKIQSTINPHKIFDMNVLANQVTQEELDYFNDNGIWPWSEEVIELYKQATNENPFVRQDPENATNYARTIYNQNAIIRVLTYQSKEGQFLLNGIQVKDKSPDVQLPSGFGTFPHSSGLMNKPYDTIKCNLKSDNSIPTLERIKSNGTTTPFDFTTLSQIIPGFTFLGSPCNPCGSMASNPDYSCKYKLGKKSSSIWEYLWNTNN